uniref:Hypothetical conserved protein n=2 Tax=Thermoproteati TaxID=1783275 RepID=Q4LEJ4_9ARCH|nr:hypothetical conserved protein [uncultured Candidatus Nitrosocaldus sp.]BAL60291.1 hypothetical conserved protein [uncultured crenarchaeote]
MMKELRKNILRLLKEDEEFRYAVAGLIGLEDIRASMKRLEEAIVMLTNIQTRMDSRLDKVETRVGELKDKVSGVETRLDKVETRVGELKDKVSGVETRVGELKDKVSGVETRLDKVETRVGELKDKVSTLEERFNGLEGALYYGFDQVGRFAGVTLEELVRGIITKNMQKNGELSQDKAITSIRLDSEEIDLFCDEPLIVGEVTSYADSVEEVDKLLRKVSVVRNKYGKEPVRKILIISSVKEEIAGLIADKAKKSGIELIMGKRR